MPDIVAWDHPRVTEIIQMGPEVYAWRRDRSREALHSVCLYHGACEAHITFQTITPKIGWLTFGKPIVTATVAVPCYPGCGYRLEWRLLA